MQKREFPELFLSLKSLMRKVMQESSEPEDTRTPTFSCVRFFSHEVIKSL